MIPRTWLYVPGDRPDRITKALASAADAVVIDLEDAVPPHNKVHALATTMTALMEHDGRKPLWVRLNAPGSPWLDHEMHQLADLGPAISGVRLPKAENWREVALIAQQIDCQMDLLVESARGLMNLADLATCHPRIRTVMLGEADLAADLRVERDGLAWARGWVVASTRAAGLISPVQSVWTDVNDLKGLEASTRAGRSQGFHGRSIIHPRQIDVVNRVFTPTDDELNRAQTIIQAAEDSSHKPGEPILLKDGQFIDPAIIAQARNTLDLAKTTESSTEA